MAGGIGRPVGDRDFLARLELESGGSALSSGGFDQLLACVHQAGVDTLIALTNDLGQGADAQA
ncbi:hypothetical protein ACVWZA_002615 [Sphingomonas sp. UYAg733]